METEVEAKWLNADHQQLAKKLKELGAKLIQPNRLMKRKTFDFPGNTLEANGGWVRVRNEGDKITLAYKQLNDRSLHGTKEVSVVVSDFDDTCRLLEAIGLEQKSYQETKRESWELNGCQIELDEWPWIKPMIEIEAPDERMLRELSNDLGLEWKDAIHGSVENAYQAEYDFTEAEIDAWPEITFVDPPDWLTAKSKS